MNLRASLARRLNYSVHWRIDERVGADLAELREQLAVLERNLRELHDRDDELDKRLGEVERRLDAVTQESAWSANELARLAPQAAAFEARLERSARPTVLTGSLEDLPEARLLLEVIREEHARVRARLSLVSAYEERLRRLEQQAPATGWPPRG